VNFLLYSLKVSSRALDGMEDLECLA
jgi:hypothetical protein